MTSSILSSSSSSSVAANASSLQPPVGGIARGNPRLAGSAIGRSFCDSNLFEPHLVENICEMVESIGALTLIRELTCARAISPSRFPKAFKIRVIGPILAKIAGHTHGTNRNEQRKNYEKLDRVASFVHTDTLRNSLRIFYCEDLQKEQAFVPYMNCILEGACKFGHMNTVKRLSELPIFPQLSLPWAFCVAEEHTQQELVQFLRPFLLERLLQEAENPRIVDEDPYITMRMALGDYKLNAELMRSLIELAKSQGKMDLATKIENCVKKSSLDKKKDQACVFFAAATAVGTIAVIYYSLPKEFRELFLSILFAALRR